MGAGASVEDAEHRKKSRAIDEQLAKDLREAATILKLLLLGAGESGKSTILKQMRILHSSGFTDDEIRLQATVIRQNILEAIALIMLAIPVLNIPLHLDEEEQMSEELILKSFANPQTFEANETVAEAVKRLWQMKPVQACYERANEFQLSDSAKYFLDDVDRIFAKSYRPTQEDILRARARTTGIIEVPFVIKNKKLRVFDVGGQRSERRKWIHCFDDVTAIMFLVAISEYDQTLLENNKTNRMQESIGLFSSICNSHYFVNTNMILFLNKKDLFELKIKKTNITTAFPEYAGAQTYDDCSTYILLQFNAANLNPKRKVYTHFTCATDTDQVEKVLRSAIDSVIDGNLSQTGVV